MHVTVHVRLRRFFALAPILALAFGCGLSAAPRQERYILVLEDAPLAVDSPAGMNKAQMLRSARASGIAAKQAAMARSLVGLGMHVSSTSQILLNAVYVVAPAGSEEKLRALPGVRFADRLRPIKRHLSEALDLVNIQPAWSAVNGSQSAGAGVKVAILDTGIDTGHPAMRDPSLSMPAGFPKCTGSHCDWTNTKVIAARSYVSLLAGTDPVFTRPDDLSPRDRVGHGTAVATVVGGVRNTGPVATFSGVAPRVWLGNYKIFGSPGLNATFTYTPAIVNALEDALADGMDIAVLSLGGPAFFGPTDRCSDSQCPYDCDPIAMAVENVIRRGLTVVISAGNDGDKTSLQRYPAFNSITSPGTAPSAITVGASTNRHVYYQSIRITGPGVPSDLQRINTYFGDGPKPDARVSLPVVDVTTLGDNGEACSPLAAGSLNGAIALIQRSENCLFATKINNAQKGGAAGVILYQPVGVNGTFPINGVNQTGIPAALIGSTVGLSLKSYIAQQPSARATLDPSLTEVPALSIDVNTMAFFSSRGPSTGLSRIKPELVAVGTDLYVATQRYDPNGELYDASGYTAVQGTSFAAPMVAGALAIVKQRNPRMTPAQLKSAVVNTANARITDVDFSGSGQGRIIDAGVRDLGAGKLDAGAAVTTNVTAEPSTVSFGVLPAGALPTAATPFTFCNQGTATVNLRLSVVPMTGTAGSAQVALSASTLSLNGGQCNSGISARLTGTRPGPGAYEGAIQVTGGSVILRIPYLFIVSDNIPFDVLSLEYPFDKVQGQSGNQYLSFKVVDQFGAPVPDVTFRVIPTLGDSSVAGQLDKTNALGRGDVDIRFGTQVGEHELGVVLGTESNYRLFLYGNVRQQPTISTGGVVNAASQQAGRGFAPGSYISIYGRALSDALKIYSTSYLPLSLAGVGVSFDAPTQKISVPGRLHFVNAGQINVLIPWELQGVTSAQMKVTIGDHQSELVTIPIAAASPAMFEYTDSSGRVFAAAVGETGIIGTGNSAKRGGIISLYVNGLGAVDNQPASGEPGPLSPLAQVRVTPTVTVGGRLAEVFFAGLAPNFVGLYQMNIRVPADAPTGSQPVVITAGGVPSKAANLLVE